MKVKFIEDYKNFSRGMQYPFEQFDIFILAELQEQGIVKIFPPVRFERKPEGMRYYIEEEKPQENDNKETKNENPKSKTKK